MRSALQRATQRQRAPPFKPQAPQQQSLQMSSNLCAPGHACAGWQSSRPETAGGCRAPAARPPHPRPPGPAGCQGRAHAGGRRAGARWAARVPGTRTAPPLACRPDPLAPPFSCARSTAGGGAPALRVELAAPLPERRRVGDTLHSHPQLLLHLQVHRGPLPPQQSQDDGAQRRGAGQQQQLRRHRRQRRHSAGVAAGGCRQRRRGWARAADLALHRYFKRGAGSRRARYGP